MATGLSRAVAAGIKSKVGVAVLAGLLATGGATGVAAAASNGAFGQQVKEQVQDCKAQLASGTHGIGDCAAAAQRREAVQHARHPRQVRRP